MAVATGETLPNDLFNGSGYAEWWVISAPPYYCYNSGSNNTHINADNTWLGNSFSPIGTVAAPDQYTNGVKFAYTTYNGVNPNSDVRFIDGSGTTQELRPLNNSSGPYQPSPLLQDTYEVPDESHPIKFGPYQLSLTRPDGQLVQDDIMFITTGSDVIGGSGINFDSDDTRSFNLIFYVTGSANADRLSNYVSNGGYTFSDYSPSSRATWYKTIGVTGFVAIRSVASPSEVIWWPLTYSQGTPERIISRNDA